jgi:adenylate cyclase
MAEDRVQRRLAAILATDVVGYSRLMGQDEAGTLAAVKALRSELVDRKIVEHKGRVFKAIGDGVLAEFPSVVNAVACAVDIQREMQARYADMPEDRAITLRIGVNLGDVIVEGEDIFGDGVNVAARLEGFAMPGGIAVSAVVRDQIGNRLDLQFEDMGEQTLKNIERPVRAFRVSPRGPEPVPLPPPPLPDKPSIAVMPFTNMSNDPSHEFFADGMTEDLTTALSRIGELFVISRNSTFVYKGKPHRLETVARELGVRYVLEGSIRASGSKVRVTAQLIDGLSGNHVWAERYDGNLDDVFAVQDEITRNIALALQIKLTFGEFARLWEGQTKDLRAWEKMVVGRNLFLRFTPADTYEAQRILEEALRIDPRYTGAMVQLGLAYWWDARSNTSVDKDHYLRLAEEQADKALSIDPRMGAAHMLKGGVAFLRDQHDLSVRLCQTAVELAPSDSWAMAFHGTMCIYAGETAKAIASLKAAMRLSPHYPAWYTYNLALANLWMGNVAQALDAARTYLRQEPEDVYAYMNLATVCGFDQQDHEAAQVISTSREKFPYFTLAHVALSQRYREREKLDRVMAVLRRAGLPD